MSQNPQRPCAKHPHEQNRTTALPLTFVNELPPRNVGRPRGSTWGVAEAAQLRANPGRWAEFDVTDLTSRQVMSRASIVRSKCGSWEPAPRHRFQASVRTDRVTKQQKLFGRYVSEAQIEFEQGQARVS